MNLHHSPKNTAIALALASSFLLVSTSQADWTILDSFESDTTNWSKTLGVGFDGLGNTSILNAVADPSRPGNQVLSYAEGNAKGIYHTLGANAIPVGGTATLYFEWYLPVGGNYDVGVGMSDEAVPAPPSDIIPASDYPDFAFRAQASDDNPFVHFKIQTLPDPSNSGTWHVTTTPFTQGVWWSYWMVIENLGGNNNAVSYHASLLGEAPEYHWTGNYQPLQAFSLESLFLIGGGGGLNTDTTYYDNFAIAPGENLTTPVPEPSTYAFLAGLLACLTLLRRRR